MKKWVFFVAPPALLIFIALGGEIVRSLWNWLLPELFGWRQISFWQALGLLALCRILFGSFGGGGPQRSHSSRRRWERMTPEEREKFRQSMRVRCREDEAPAGGTSEPA